MAEGKRTATLTLELVYEDGEIDFYKIHPIERDNAKVNEGWRLTKDDGTHYNVGFYPHDSCDCADFTYRREGIDPKGCKHIRALRAYRLMG